MSGAKGCKMLKREKKDSRKEEKWMGMGAHIRLSGLTPITAIDVDTSNNIWLFKLELNFMKTSPAGKD